MTPAIGVPSPERAARLTSALAVVVASAAAVALLVPDPFADAFFAGWVLLLVGLAVAGAVGAWTNRPPLVWVAALLTTGLAVVGMMSIGLLVAPVALLLVLTAGFSHVSGPREGVREAIVADPPSARVLALKSLAGVTAVAVGGWLVNLGAVARPLFGACARETLSCALAVTHWDAVAITALGLLSVSFGAWLVWRGSYVARVLASEGSG
ncbi:hypothetical protein HZS55_05530 [Halosimplex rubrum]|uniref:Uncharacterized protein n=1 Tax=Halosimplex rubrum TaxID=869889 RepID=A0A7D5P400_9EURY|nr:hypothetical protein [Halosimplex rubrum]QLH76798.1 hypothetical protein HZS55_05530 [Halosimplex rubrum]